MAKYQTVIAGSFVDAFSPQYRGWIGINDGMIAIIAGGRPPAIYSDNMIEFDHECIIIPGLVNVHVHCREPGNEYKEDWYTLGLAAAHGGVTTVAAEPNYGKGNSVINRERFEKVKDLSRKCIVDVRHWAGLNPENLEHLDEFDDQLIIGYKLFTTPFDPELTFPREPQDEFFQWMDYAFEKAARTGKRVAVHCEDPMLFDESAKSSGVPWAYADWRTESSEIAMVKGIISSACKYGARLHITHPSAKETFDVLRQYPWVTYEVTWHHANKNKYAMAEDRRLVMNPPLRSEESRARASAEMNIGDAWDACMGSDHAPHTLEEKIGDSPPAGVPSLDSCGSLLRERIVRGQMTPQTAAGFGSYNGSKLLGLYDRGEIALGKRADFAVLRMTGNGRGMKIYSKCGWDPFGVPDYVEATIKEGRLLFKEGEPVMQ